ncbi:hypothetical protein [Aliivibrio sifiae]|uniref:hypothetical protein n=1 Tax=Aliivibrio sifiae TaxID=566293 RepID=UPI003D0D178B
MSRLNSQIKKNKVQNKAKFIPFHHLALFDRTYAATKNHEGVVCAMLCVAVIEAYLNDVEGWYSYVGSTPIMFHEKDRPANNYLKDEEREFLDKLAKSENKRFKDKLRVFGVWEESDKLCQDIDILLKIRNGLTHLKPEELLICKDTGDFEGYPKFLNNLFQKKIIQRPKVPMSWIESLESHEFCLWCQEITYNFTRRLTDSLLKTTVQSEFAKTAMFKFDADYYRS